MKKKQPMNCNDRLTFAGIFEGKLSGEKGRGKFAGWGIFHGENVGGILCEECLLKMSVVFVWD